MKHVVANNFATTQNKHIMTTGMDSARDVQSSMSHPPCDIDRTHLFSILQKKYTPNIEYDFTIG